MHSKVFSWGSKTSLICIYIYIYIYICIYIYVYLSAYICLYLLSDIRFCISVVFAKINFCRIIYREADLKTMKSWAKYNFFKIQIFKIFHIVDRKQFITSTRERKEEYPKLLLFKLKWSILGSSASSLLQFRSEKWPKNLFLTNVSSKNEYGMSIEMTLSVIKEISLKICSMKISASFICLVASNYVWSVKSFSCS